MAARDELRSTGRNAIFSFLTFLIPFFGRGIRRRLEERQARLSAISASQKGTDHRASFMQDMQKKQNEAARVRGAGEARAEAARAAAAKRH